MITPSAATGADSAARGFEDGKDAHLDVNEFKGKGGMVPGGAATVSDLPLDQKRS